MSSTTSDKRMEEHRTAKRAPPETYDSTLRPPYRSDTYTEHPLVEIPHAKMETENLHQEGLVQLIRKIHWCPEPLPRLLKVKCPPSDTDMLRSERIHVVLQLLSQLREHQQQALLRRVYKTFGSDHRKAAKELYARELFSTAYIQYWTLFICLSCDKCRNLSKSFRHNTTVDLLEKLSVTCLRAGWVVDAENFAAEALHHEKRSTRARLWLATAQLGLGKLDLARKNLTMLPLRGDFPRDFPSWIESRTVAQRAILERLENEADGEFNIDALELDPLDQTPATPHSTALFHIKLTPFGYRTKRRVEKGELLLVAAPLVCVSCYTPEKTAQQQPKTVHEENPSVLSLARIADATYEKSKALSHVRRQVLAAAARGGVECESVIDLVGNQLRAAAIVVTQKYTMNIPHKTIASSETCPSTSDSGTGTTVEKSAYAGHALYLPALDLRSSAPLEGNTYATFHGPHLFLRAARDLMYGTIIAFDDFPRTGGGAADRARISAPAPDVSTPSTSHASSPEPIQ